MKCLVKGFGCAAAVALAGAACAEASLDAIGEVLSGEVEKLAQPGVVKGLLDGSVKVGVDGAAVGRGLKAIGLTPFAENGWSKGMNLPDLSDLKLDASTLAEMLPLAAEVIDIALKAGAREAKHAADLAAKGLAEEPASKAACRFQLDVGQGKLLFDKWGELFIDRRFVTQQELPKVKRMESLYRKVFPSAKVASTPAAGLSKTPRQAPGGGALPIFRGFEDERYQRYDALIVKLTKDFNEHKAVWCGGTAAQAAKVTALEPAMVKSHMIEETGGNGPASKAAWQVDPLQVNVPGDWGPEKEALGLKKPVRRNEGTVEGNVKAAIMYLSRKGFGVSGQPAAKRPSGFFDGWPDALRRYNGRRDRTASGRFYSDDYSEKIRQRAANPDAFVPIEIKLAAKK